MVEGMLVMTIAFNFQPMEKITSFPSFATNLCVIDKIKYEVLCDIPAEKRLRETCASESKMRKVSK